MPPRGRPSAEAVERARRIRLLAFDVDGVLTDGSLLYGPDGEALKRFDVKDGHGIVLCRVSGIPSAILSARSSPAVAARARELGMVHVLQGEKDKERGLERLLAAANVPAELVGYVGDDVNDLPVLARVGLAACPADAAPEVRRAVHHVCAVPGGRGAAREVCELVLKARGLWDGALLVRAKPPA